MEEAQLEVLDERVKARREIFQRYYEHLSQSPGIQFMPELEGTYVKSLVDSINVDEKEARSFK